jgi:subtilisin family serine protease
VGAVNPLPYGPANSKDISVASFSSWGPTDDGRIKPDIVGDGVDVLSTGNANPASYITLSGTSMSAPNITGSLYLLQEYYSQKNGGAFMRAATLKGLACHTAFDAGNAGPDYIYGWGLLDMNKAAGAITDNGTLSLIKEARNKLTM